MVIQRLTPQQQARVTAAVAEAERDTDGEIVTVLAERSDSYNDVALHYGVAAMLMALAVSAVAPGALEAKLSWMSGGWMGRTDIRQLLFFILLVQAIAFLVVRYALAWTPLRLALTPHTTRSRRVRRRAVQFFRIGAEKRTEGRVGILLYLSLIERHAEIVADEAIHSKVPNETWGEAMAALVDHLHRGDAAGGMVAAVEGIGKVLQEHFPKTPGNRNELPDRLIQL